MSVGIILVSSDGEIVTNHVVPPGTMSVDRRENVVRTPDCVFICEKLKLIAGCVSQANNGSVGYPSLLVFLPSYSGIAMATRIAFWHKKQ